MGWSFTCDTSVDRKKLVAEILEDFRRNEHPYPTLLDHSRKGNTLYLLLRNPARKPANYVRAGRFDEVDLAGLTFDLVGNYRFIAIYLLAGGGRIGCGWGYKSMDESMGPNEIDCPERLLKQSQVLDRHGWRADCRQAREDAKLRREWVKTLRVGSTLQKLAGWKYNREARRNDPIYREVVFERPYSKTFFIGHFQGESTRYRIRWSEVKIPEDVKEAA